MLKMPDAKMKYFSVKHSTKIQGVRYTPSVCYPLAQDLRAVIEKMASEDTARIYPEKVRFVTGAPYPVKKPETRAPQPSSAPAAGVKTAAAGKPAAPITSAALGKLGRKPGKNAGAPPPDREFD
jgi:hypothetical protein